MSKMIVKMQTPISTNGSKAEALVYNQDRQIMFSVIIDKKVKEMMNGQHKKYFELELNEKTEEIKFGKEVKAQNW